MTLNELKESINEREQNLQKREIRNQMKLEEISNKREVIEEAKQKVSKSKQATQFIEDIANSRRMTIKRSIEEVATEALQLIYGDTYKMELDYSIKANRTNVKIELLKDTDIGTVRRNMGGFGGGVADTIAVPLKLLVLIANGTSDKILLCDESWKHIDNQRIHQAGEFIKHLCDKLGLQLIMLSHHEALENYADRVYNITNDGTKAYVERIK